MNEASRTLMMMMYTYAGHNNKSLHETRKSAMAKRRNLSNQMISRISSFAACFQICSTAKTGKKNVFRGGKQGEAFVVVGLTGYALSIIICNVINYIGR